MPELFAYETFSILCRLHPNPRQTYDEGVLRLLSSGLLRYPMTEGIAHRAARFVGFGLSGYDAVYVALAEELGAQWLTFDAKAHRLVQQEGLSLDLDRTVPEGWSTDGP